MDKPRINTATVYTTVANLLPTEGRDFTIDAAYDASGKPKIIITPLTAIGSAWVPFLQKGLEEPMKRDGVGVQSGGSTASEVMTINSVRAKVEREAAEALQRRIAAAENDQKQKAQAADAARKEQVAKEGESAQPNPTVSAAYRAANEAARNAYRLKRASQKIAGIRADVDKAAIEAAKADAKNGRVWDVDMEAPLTSLFDQQDVTGKFRSKEDMILNIANHMVDIDDIRANAVNMAKQYIIQKEKTNG